MPKIALVDESHADQVVLSMPRDRSYHGVAELVLSGLASRRVTFEGLEDLLIGLESLLDRRDVGDQITIKLRLDDGEIETSVGPFLEDVGRELARVPGREVDLRRVLDTVADGVEVVEERDGYWVRLTKLVQPAGRKS